MPEDKTKIIATVLKSIAVGLMFAAERIENPEGGRITNA